MRKDLGKQTFMFPMPVLIGEIVNISADESVLTNGKIDIKKLVPIAFDGENNKYNVIGEEVADAFKIGLSLK